MPDTNKMAVQKGEKGNGEPEPKGSSIPVNSHRKMVSSYLNAEFSGGSVDDVITRLKASCPSARICEDITETSKRMSLKFSKEVPTNQTDK